MHKKENNVVGNIRKFIRNRSRSPGGNTRSGGFGSALGLLQLEQSPIETNQNTPKIFNTLVRQLRPHIATEGLFRVSVPNRVLQQLKAKIEIDRLDNNSDPHVLACGLKAWLRELPQGLIPPPFQDQLLLATNDQNEIRRVISTLPELNKATLNLLFELLNSVSKTDKNRMTAGALAVVVGPSLFRVQATSEGLQTTQKTNEVAMKFIKDYQIFRTEFSSESNSIPSPTVTKNSSERIEIAEVHVNGNDRPVAESPPPSPSPRVPVFTDLKKVIDETIDRALGNSTDNDSPRSPPPPHPAPSSFDPEHHKASSESSNSSHQRLRLPSRPVPLRGSRRKPSRNRTKTTSGESSNHETMSHNSLGCVDTAETNVYARLGDGESLEGWRIESTPNTSMVPTPVETPSQTPQSILHDIPSDAMSKSPDIAPKSPYATSKSPDNSTFQLSPKPPPLDLSALAIDSPAMSPRAVPKSVMSDTESLREDFTAVNTPRTSPEPDPLKYSSCPNDSSVANSPVNNFNRSLTKDSNSTRRKTNSKSKVKGQTSSESRHKKQLSSESELGSIKKQRGRSPRKSRDKSESENHVAQLTTAVSDLEKRMQDKRDISCRGDSIDQMTELQLREEKSELQRELLILESTFGRPNAGPERQVVRLVYHRYRELKRRLSRLDNRSTNDREAFLREIESELSKIERERRELGKSIKSWEAQFRIENNRNPSTDEKIRNLEYSRYRVLKARRNFLQDLQQQTAPESFTV